MKSILKDLYFSNRRHFDVWNYLWLISEEGAADFSYTDVCARFKVPKSTLVRILQLEKEWNKEFVYSRVERLEKNHRVIFFDKPQRIDDSKIELTKREKNKLRTDAMLEWLKVFYKQKEKEYLNIGKHKSHIGAIMSKVETITRQSNKKAPDEEILNNGKIFFGKIPEWWITNAFTLPTINKNFTQIYNHIKTNQNGTSKQSTKDSYTKAASDTSKIDYSKITN